MGQTARLEACDPWPLSVPGDFLSTRVASLPLMFIRSVLCQCACTLRCRAVSRRIYVPSAL